MRPFKQLTAPAAPLPVSNVNTDDIIPAQRMMGLSTDGLGSYLFERMRYTPEGDERAEFVLNQIGFRDAGILISHSNFGCGSSREHAVWALLDFGIHCIIAPSFASIFTSNAIRNGLLLVSLSEDQCDVLIEEVRHRPGAPMRVDLKSQSIATPAERIINFEIDAIERRLLLEGLDDVERTLKHEDMISFYEAQRRP